MILCQPISNKRVTTHEGNQIVRCVSKAASMVAPAFEKDTVGAGQDLGGTFEDVVLEALHIDCKNINVSQFPAQIV